MRMRGIFENEDGQGLVEYGIILAIVSVAAISAVVLIESKMANVFKEASTKLEKTS